MIGNGGIPIQSLAGITSLTDILPELPLPKPVHSSLSQQSLFYNQRVAQQAELLLSGQQPAGHVLDSIGRALAKTDTSSVEFKNEGYAAKKAKEAGVPALFQAIVAQNSHLFEHRPEFAPYCQPALSNGQEPQEQQDSPKKQHKHKKKKKKKDRSKERDSSAARSEAEESGSSSKVTVVSREAAGGIKLRLVLGSPTVKPIRIGNPPGADHPVIVPTDEASPGAVAAGAAAAVTAAADDAASETRKRHKKEKKQKKEKHREKRRSKEAPLHVQVEQEAAKPPQPPAFAAPPAPPAGAEHLPHSVLSLMSPQDASPTLAKQQQQQLQQQQQQQQHQQQQPATAATLSPQLPSKLQELLTKGPPAQQQAPLASPAPPFLGSGGFDPRVYQPQAPPQMQLPPHAVVPPTMEPAFFNNFLHPVLPSVPINFADAGALPNGDFALGENWPEPPAPVAYAAQPQPAGIDPHASFNTHIGSIGVPQGSPPFSPATPRSFPASKGKPSPGSSPKPAGKQAPVRQPRRPQQPRRQRHNRELSGLISWQVRDKAAEEDADGWESRLSKHNTSLVDRMKKHRRGAQQRRGNVQDLVESDASDEEADGGAPKRQKRDDDEDFKVRLKDSAETRFAPLVKSNKDSKPRERVRCGLSVNLTLMSTEELVESDTFVRFKELVDQILEAVEDVDIKVLDDSDELPNELKISSRLLSELCVKANQVKSVGVMREMPTEKLVRLLTLLLVNIKDGARVVPLAKPGDEEDGEGRLWREIYMERVMRSVEASLTSLIIMTSPNMPKQVFLEDVIEKAVSVAKFQLNNTVYPEVDPAYRKINKHRNTQQSIKTQRAKERAGISRPRAIAQLFNRLVELFDCFAHLVDVQKLTDNVILSMSTLGVAPFFVENVENLQLNALKVTTGVFSHYEKHRQLILEDIFASLARLPSSKRNLRSFRLNSEESIQMMTALALLLIQSVVKLPAKKPKNRDEENEVSMNIMEAYEASRKTAQIFLAVFLKKCVKKGEEQDYRGIFENFVEDLLLTVNKPEWPAAELFLSILGGLLVKQFANKSVDQGLRVASLDYLGTVASRLRKDAVSSQLNEKDVDSLVCDIRNHTRGMEEAAEAAKEEPPVGKEEKISILQKTIIDYLNAEDIDSSIQYSIRFYLSQWFKDSSKECEKTIQMQKDASNNDESAAAQATLEDLEQRKSTLLQRSCDVATQERARKKLSHGDAYILEYEDACLVCRYLASMRPFSQSFDIYLSQILKVLNEQSVAVRTKAIKCLTAVVEVDPSVLERTDIERTVHGRFLDNSTSVREACIELIGKFIIVRPQLTAQYYGMLSERILDTGISVRKRVIKIFRDICVEQPDFNKIPEMCVKMIKRVNDEDGIRKLVNEVFQTMWFTPVKETQTVKLLQKVMNITDVVAACKDQGYDWFENLLRSLLKEEKEEKLKPVEKACKQIVDTLVANIMRLEEISSNNNQRLVACLCTLYMFSKIRPNLMVEHSSMLQSYLKIKISTQQDNYVLHYVAKILELTVPLIENPNEEDLHAIEQEMVQLTMRKGMMVLDSAIACLSAVVNRVTKNYALIRSCFNLFYTPIDRQQQENIASGAELIDPKQKPSILRGLYTVGLLLKYFDLENITTYETNAIRQRVFGSFMFFCSYCRDADVVKKALMGLGFMCARHSDLLLQDPLKSYYSDLITNPQVSNDTKALVLKNLSNFLVEEESSMAQADSHWKDVLQHESLKEMQDVQSGRGSMVAQAYLDQSLSAFYNRDWQVRQAALAVVVTILRQGLIHPVKTVAHLISIQSDAEPTNRAKADSQLLEIEKHYPSFINMRALSGVRQSYQLQRVLHPSGIVRGIRDPDADPPVAMNHSLYSMLRANRMNRRVLLSSMLNLFDDSHSQRAPLAELLYVADNLASFPYQVAEEPLFLVHHLDLLVSVAGSNVLTGIKDYLGFAPGTELPDGCTPEMLATRIPENCTPVQSYLLHSKGICLLLSLRQYVRELYGISDSKIQNYSPSDSAKTWEKQLNRRTLPAFRPQRCLDFLAIDGSKQTPVMLAADILDFENLMLTIDPTDAAASGDEEASAKQPTAAGDAASGKQMPCHPAVQRGLGLKVQLTRLDDGQSGAAEAVEIEDEAAVNSDASSEGPRIRMPKPRKKSRVRRRKRKVSEESDSISSLSSDSLSD